MSPTSSPTTSPVLIIGASRGLGLALTKYYSNTPRTVYATLRSPPKPGTLPSDVTVIQGIDVGEEDAGTKIVQALKGDKLGLVVVVSGVLNPEVSASYPFSHTSAYATEGVIVAQ